MSDFIVETVEPRLESQYTGRKAVEVLGAQEGNQRLVVSLNVYG